MIDCWWKWVVGLRWWWWSSFLYLVVVIGEFQRERDWWISPPKADLAAWAVSSILPLTCPFSTLPISLSLSLFFSWCLGNVYNSGWLILVVVGWLILVGGDGFVTMVGCGGGFVSAVGCGKGGNKWVGMTVGIHLWLVFFNVILIFVYIILMYKIEK